MPSIRPSAPAEAPSVPVRNVGSTEVVISWPESDNRLAAPTAPTPGVNQRGDDWPEVAGSPPDSVTGEPAVTYPMGTRGLVVHSLPAIH
jgi:hypothetical protein